jgi:hypothetical protein
MLNARKHMEDIDARREFSFRDKGCQVTKDDIARMETIRECIYNWIYNNKMKMKIGPKSASS